MKIGIYDKWLREFGGGEKVASVMAETLSKKGHQVELISLVKVDKEILESRMGVDLLKVKIISWLDRRQESLTDKTSEYDLFINVSFLDHLPSQANKSLYYILFPTPIRKSFLGFIKYETLLPFLRKSLIIPEITQGLDDVEEIVGEKGGKWVGKNNQIVFSNTPQKMILVMRFYIEEVKLSDSEYINFSSPNCAVSVIRKKQDPNSNVLAYTLKVVRKGGDASVLELTLSDKAKDLEIALVSFTIKNPRYFAWNIIKFLLPEYEMALYGSSGYKPAAGLSTYDMFLADSKFSAYWTKKYWKEKAEVLYPPVDVHEFKPGKKKNIILSVGRFFVGGHSKKQHILVETFKNMVDKRLLDETWELHLVGGIARGDVHTEYVEKIRKSAKGYPIYIHISASFKKLKKLYSEAKIYWHAAGFGESKSEPIKMEHFGISPVEAMAAGCVPLVYDGGGLGETVGDKELTWKNSDQLIEKTVKIANDKTKSSKISKEVQQTAQKFSRSNFSKKLIEYINSLENS